MMLALHFYTDLGAAGSFLSLANADIDSGNHIFCAPTHERLSPFTIVLKHSITLILSFSPPRI